jgi:lysylphosphatidylglycerol synthetase-like protein (DUF2156 family)
MPFRSSETRRIRSLLGQRRVSDVVMVAILSVALLAGLVGFAVHVLWIAAIVVLGLGYVVANARQDRREVIERLAQTILYSTEDKVEGANAFLEKRPAQFRGR